MKNILKTVHFFCGQTNIGEKFKKKEQLINLSKKNQMYSIEKLFHFQMPKCRKKGTNCGSRGCIEKTKL